VKSINSKDYETGAAMSVSLPACFRFGGARAAPPRNEETDISRLVD